MRPQPYETEAMTHKAEARTHKAKTHEADAGAHEAEAKRWNQQLVGSNRSFAPRVADSQKSPTKSLCANSVAAAAAVTAAAHVYACILCVFWHYTFFNICHYGRKCKHHYVTTKNIDS